MTSPLTIIARSLGVTESDRPIPCAICVESPYAGAGRAGRVLPRSFTNHYDLAAPHIEQVCEGCRALMGGRPGRVPPPLRTRSFSLALESRRMIGLMQSSWWELLSNRPRSPQIVSWARSRKKHHYLHAGISQNGEWRIGSDDGPIIAEHDSALLLAITALRELGAT